MIHIGISAIDKHDDRTLKIKWNDGKEHLYDVVELRKNCPCALCIDEMTGKKTLDDLQIADSVRPLKIDSVGRYAINIKFSDQHSTGIYTYQLLRSLV